LLQEQLDRARAKITELGEASSASQAAAAELRVQLAAAKAQVRCAGAAPASWPVWLQIAIGVPAVQHRVAQQIGRTSPLASLGCSNAQQSSCTRAQKYLTQTPHRC
jgi:hypothetical protein